MLIFMILCMIVLTTSSMLEKKNSSSDIIEKDLFWNVFDLLKSNNDLDIQNILMVSEQTHCQCDNSLCDTVTQEIVQNKYLIPYTCISLSHLKYNVNYTNLFENNLIDSKPTLVIMFGSKESMLQKILKTNSALPSKHIWLILDGFKQHGININEEHELNLTDTSSLEQLQFDSKIFLWKGELSKGYFWEIYRMCTQDLIVAQPLLSFNKSHILKNNFQYIWERRRNLRSCEIKVAYINRPPYMYERSSSLNMEEDAKAKTCFLSGKKTMCGNYAPLLKLIVNQLNFTILWVKASDGNFGHLNKTNRKWTGLLGLLANNDAHISPCWHFITASKKLNFDFSSPITRFGAHLYMKKPHMAASWGTYYDVFEDSYWLVMIIFSLVISILFCGFSIFYHKIKFGGNEVTYSIKYAVSYLMSGIATVCLSLGCQDVSIGVPRHLPVVISLRIIFLVTCVFGMLNYYVYSSGLISLLTVEKYDLPINKLEDFLEQDYYKIMIMRNDGLESYFSDADDSVRKIIWKEQMMDNTDAYVSSPIQGDKLMMENQERVLLLTQDSATGLSNYPCGLSRTAREFSRKSVGYAFQKNSVYVGLFSYILNDLIEYGNVQYIQSLIQMEKHSSTCDHNKEYRPLGYENIFSVFIIFIAGVVFSGGFALIELIYLKCRT